MTFKQDRLEHEKNEPVEGSSLKFINVPIAMIALFLGFGITYLTLRTDNMNMSPGDSRTTVASEKPPSENEGVAAVADDLPTLMAKGKQIYTTTCQACHQATGLGLAGAFPPLAESEWVTASAERMAAIILHGLQGEITVNGVKYQSVMPPFKDQLNSDDIAAVATYVRNSFGNKADKVTAGIVEKVKERTQSRTTPWDGEVELKAQNWEE